MIVSEKNKDLKLIKNRFFSSEKRRNSGNFIYDYAHSFFGEDFQFNALQGLQELG